MRKSSLDFSSYDAMLPTDQVQKKTERSHEENQERAYIAASRRTDRSLEARVQSARMASEIHKKRTGKGFRISEEIVLKEEMYEEEDDDLPRSYRLLGPSMQTSSPDMNHRVEAYLSNKFAMSAMLARTNEEWRQNEINKLFAQSFPNIGGRNGNSNGDRHGSPGSGSDNQVPQHTMTQAQQAQRAQLAQQFQHMQQIQQAQQQMQQAQQAQQAQQPVPPQMPSNFAQANQYYNSTYQHNRNQSFSGTPSYGSPTHDDFRQRHHSAETQFTPVPENPQSQTYSNRSMSPVDLGSSRSAFTTELPTEAKMLMGDMDYQSYQNMFAGDACYGSTDVPRANMKLEPDDQLFSPMNDSFDINDIKWDSMAQSTSPMDDWSTFINDGAWDDDQAQLGPQ